MKGHYGPGLYYYRTLRKINQKTVASWLGMTRQNLSDIERNKSKISEQRLVIVAQRLNVTVAQIKQFGVETPVIISDRHESTSGNQPEHSLVTVPLVLLRSLEASLGSLQKAYELLLEEKGRTSA